MSLFARSLKNVSSFRSHRVCYLCRGVLRTVGSSGRARLPVALSRTMCPGLPLATYVGLPRARGVQGERGSDRRPGRRRRPESRGGGGDEEQRNAHR